MKKKFFYVMNKLLFFFLFATTTSEILAKIYPEEIVEMFEQNPEMFNILAQMSYHYMADRENASDSKENLLKKSLETITLDSIPGIELTNFEKDSMPKNSIVAFVSPYCPHCRTLIKNLIQLEKEKFFGNHTTVHVVYAPTNSASHCATKALLAAHKMKKNDGLLKALDIIDTRFSPVEAMDWPKLFSHHHPEIPEKTFSQTMNCPATEQHSKKCAEYIRKFNMDSLPVIAIYTKSPNTKTSAVDMILGNPSHIGLLTQALKVKLKIK
ncbi:DsbA family protein [Holospora curviuscula]|uniref:DsbA family protein n=1 Tax=Holospora curviuscula TaxID=1082868 RepID=UPI001A9C30D6|nr:hypothetical protein [Holospora curviuscula]